MSLKQKELLKNLTLEVEKISVEVLPKDIDGAWDSYLQSMPSFCPVARALKRKFEDKSIIVYNTTAVIGEKSYMATPETISWIRRNDDGIKQDPFVAEFWRHIYL